MSFVQNNIATDYIETTVAILDLDYFGDFVNVYYKQYDIILFKNSILANFCVAMEGHYDRVSSNMYGVT